MWLALCLLVIGEFPASAQVDATGPPPRADGSSRVIRAQWRDHPTLRLGRSTRIEGRLRFQIDTHDADVVGDDDTAGGVDIARRRIGLQGVLFGVVEFEVDRELRRRDGWRDVYINVIPLRALQVQAGQFKLPFGQDENASSTNLDFAFRALTSTHLAPGRDRGVMAHGRLLARRLRYEAGVFEHDGRNARTNDISRVFGGRTLALRVRSAPFEQGVGRLREMFRDLQVGVAVTRSQVAEGLPAMRGRMVLEAPFFRSRYYVDGARDRFGGELRWRPGPFAVGAEYMRVSTERRGEAVDDGDLSPLVATGWYVSGTWALTGEPKARGLDTPRRPFGQGGFGAVELAARFESIGFRSTGTGEPPSSSPRADVIRGNKDRAGTVGVNWYLNRWVKLQGNLVRERLDDGEIGPRTPDRTFWSRVFRVQVAL